MRRAGATKIDAKEAGAEVYYIPLQLSLDHPQLGLALDAALRREASTFTVNRGRGAIIVPIVLLLFLLKLHTHYAHRNNGLHLSLLWLPSFAIVHIDIFYSQSFYLKSAALYCSSFPYSPLLGSRATRFFSAPTPLASTLYLATA